MISIYVPVLYEYQKARISWDAIDPNAMYRLERVFNGTFKESSMGGYPWNKWMSFDKTWADFESTILTWEQFNGTNGGMSWENFENTFPNWQYFENTITSWQDLSEKEISYVLYEGPLTEYEDLMIKGASTAVYRLTVFLPDGQSETVTSECIEIILNHPPTIELVGKTGTFLGSVYKAFQFELVFTDPDPENQVSFEVRLDNGILLEKQQQIQQRVSYRIVVTDEQVSAYKENETGMITVVAADQWGATSTVNYTFSIIEDLRLSTIYYVLRDQEPIAKIPSQMVSFFDYTAVGEHRYKIRAVDKYDNFVDSNEIIIRLDIEYATIAPVNSPWEQIQLTQRRGSIPTVARSLSPVFGRQYVAGEAYALVEDEGFRESKWNLAFTHRSLENKYQINRWAEAGTTVLYRDTFGTKIIGIIQSVEDGYVFKNASGVAIDFSIELHNIPYSEVIDYD